MKRIKILFVLPSLQGGGAERSALNIMNNLDRSRFEPVLLLFKKEGAYLGLLKKDVEVVSLNCRTRYAMFGLSKTIKRIKPDIVFSTLFSTNVLTRISLLFSKKVFICNIQNNPDNAGLLLYFISWFCKRANKIVALSEGVRKFLINKYNITPKKIVTIYNSIDIDFVKKLIKEKINYPWKKGFRIISAGKLEKQKGFDILLKALSSFNADWTLVILGEGKERKRLERLTRKLGIENQVYMPGFKKNPFLWMGGSDLFVLPSRWEGFGNVIIEAMACEVPVLATKCNYGPDEIVRNDVNGLLCEVEIEDLKEKIEFMYKNPDKRKKFIKNAKENVKKFDIKRIIKKYERLFDNFSNDSK